MGVWPAAQHPATLSRCALAAVCAGSKTKTAGVSVLMGSESLSARRATSTDGVKPILGADADRAAVQMGGTPADPVMEARMPWPAAPDDVSIPITSTQDKESRRIQALRKMNTVEKYVAGQRRLFRTAFMLAFLGIAFGLWSLGSSVNEVLEFERAYDPDGQISITIKACDVQFMSGAAATMTYSAVAGVAASISDGMWVPDYSDSSRALGAYAINKRNCNPPLSNGDCARLCSLRVRVPPGSTAQFQILQEVDDVDAGYPMVKVDEGVEFGSLRVGEWHPPRT